MRKRRARTPNRVHDFDRQERQPFVAHFHELRRRLFYIAVSVFVGGCTAYGVERHIIDVLLRPAGKQQFIYTSVGGGMDFLFKVCIDAGIIVSIPVILYQVLKFIAPVINDASNKFIAKITIASGVLAVCGLAFGYFVGLPNALHFLLHQFTTAQIKPLVTIQAYMSFVMMYMVSSALLLQAPLLLLLINRIKPLKPSGLLKHERWVILVAFVGAFIMNPTPNVIAQTMVAIPIIIAYHAGVALIWLVNRRPRGYSTHIVQLIERDAALQAERWQRLQAATFEAFKSPELIMASQSDVPVQTASSRLDEPLKPAVRRTGSRADYRYATTRPRPVRKIIQ